MVWKIKKEQVKEFFGVTLGTLLVAFGVYFFKFPNNFSTGGVTGISIIVSRYFPRLTPGTLVSVLNISLLIVGYAVFGKGFGLKTAYASLLMSGVIQLLEWIYPMDAPFTDQPLLELFFAVMLPAVGSAILFNTDASTGGTDVVAMLLRKYTNLDIGKALMASDVVITLMACAAFGMKTGLFSIFGLIVKAFLVDLVIENINMCKYFTIVCEDPEPICAYITKTLNRSATVIQATGAYSHQGRYVVLAVMRRYQAVHLQKYIRASVPGAFMMISNTSEIIGKGFRGA